VTILQRKIYFSQNEIQPKISESKLTSRNLIGNIMIDKDFVDNELGTINIFNINHPLFIDLEEVEFKEIESIELIMIQKLILVSLLKCLPVIFKNRSILKFFTNIDSRIIEILNNQQNRMNSQDSQHIFKQNRTLQLLRYTTLECHTGILVPNIHHSEFNHSVNQSHNFFSIITTTNRPSYQQSIMDNLRRQNYKNFEVLIALQPEYSDDDCSKMRDDLNKENIDFKIFKSNFSYSIGSMLNFLSNEAKYEIITKFDDDDLYLENYLLHLNLDFNNLNFDVAGKYPEFIKFENDEFITHDPGIGSRVFDNTYNISGSSLTFRKTLLTEISKFPETNKGEDELWRQNIYASRKRIIRLPGFDHIVRRNNSGHTWEYDEKVWKDVILKDNQILNLLELQSQDVDLSFLK
jgi:hypothetical protein